MGWTSFLDKEPHFGAVALVFILWRWHPFMGSTCNDSSYKETTENSFVSAKCSSPVQFNSVFFCTNSISIYAKNYM